MQKCALKPPKENKNNGHCHYQVSEKSSQLCYAGQRKT